MSSSSSSSDDDFNVFEEAKLSKNSALNESERRVVLLLNEIKDQRAITLIVQNTNSFVQYALFEAINGEKAAARRVAASATRAKRKLAEFQDRRKARESNNSLREKTAANRTLLAAKKTSKNPHTASVLQALTVLQKSQRFLQSNIKNRLLPVSVLAAIVFEWKTQEEKVADYTYADADNVLRYMIEQGTGKLANGNYLSVDFIVEHWPKGAVFQTTGKKGREFIYTGKYAIRGTVSGDDFEDLLLKNDNLSLDDMHLEEIYTKEEDNNFALIRGGRQLRSDH